MQKKTILIVLLAFVGLTAIAQTKIIDSLIYWTKTHPKIDSLHIVNLHRISYRLSEKDVNKSFDYYEKVVAYSDSLNFVYGKSLAQINLGILLFNSANFDASNRAYFKAIDYAEACGAMRLKAVSLNNIGDNLKTLQDYNKCRQYTQDAIKINTQLEAWRGVAINYELLQQCDLKENLFESAKKTLLLGMPFAEKSGESYILSQFYLGFGKIHAHAGRLDSAEHYFKLALDQAKIQGDLRNEFQVYLAKVQYIDKISSAEKINLLGKALTIARKTEFLEGISNASRELSNVYDELRSKDSSLLYYRVYRSSADSLFSENNKRNVIINESEWLIKRKEIENAHLLERSQLQSKRIAVKNALLIAVFLSLILTIVIAIIIYRTNQSKKERYEAGLKQKMTEIEMKVLRAQMNPHFIFNSLNSIENFMMQNEKRLASDYLNKFTRLIRTILDSSLKQVIPVTKDMEALQLYIDLQQLRFNNKFSYETCIDPQLINGDYKVPSLLIQPYVENAIEHGIAHSERTDATIQVSAKLKDDYIIYVITDNGIGREQAAVYNQQNKRHHKSIGLSITKKRIKIFNETLNDADDIIIEDLYGTDKEPQGTKVTVKIKIL